MPTDAAELTEFALVEFCKEFIEHPYLCYTEHGLHALFFARLYEKLPKSMRYFDFHKHRVCVIQKEYPTDHSLGKSRRQNWDISVITPPAEMPKGKTRLRPPAARRGRRVQPQLRQEAHPRRHRTALP